MSKRRSPRVAGHRLRVLARMMRAPLAGPSMSRLLVRQLLLDRLRAHDEGDDDRRLVMRFRAAPRKPDV